MGDHVCGAWGGGRDHSARSSRDGEAKWRLLLAVALTLVTLVPLAVLGGFAQAVATTDSFLDRVSSPQTRMTQLVRKSAVQDQLGMDWSKCRVYRAYWVGGATCSWVAYEAQRLVGGPRLCPVCASPISTSVARRQAAPRP